MKNLNLILSIFIVVLLSSCGNNNQNNSSSTNDDKKIEEEQKDETVVEESYMTFVSNAGPYANICLDVKYPADEHVWIDWNQNEKFDEGETLDSAEWKNYPNRDLEQDYWIDKDVELVNSTFTIYGAVTYLNCDESGITEIDISHNPHLEELICNYNDITSLDISKNEKLRILFCEGTKLTDLDISNNVNLSTLFCENTPLKTLDISNNPKLNELLLPRTFESKVFNIYPEIFEVQKELKQQKLIPKGYHILKVAYNINEEDVEEKNDKLILFEENIPYAERKENVTVKRKSIYFKSIGNNKYKVLGEDDNFSFYFAEFKNENYILKNEGDVIPQYEYYKIENGKIIRTKTFALNSVEPNAEGIYEVNDIGELLGSIGSDRTIKIMSSINIINNEIDYNYFSEYSLDCDDDNSISGIHFSGVENLTITGDLNNKPKLIFDNITSDLIFSKSKNIKLQNLQIEYKTVSKTDGMLAFIDCKNITLDNLLLYKNGKYGITTCNVEELNCSNVTIEGCNENVLVLNNCTNLVFDNFQFKNNKLTGSVIKIANSQDIIFSNGKINYNSSTENYIIEADNDSKLISFENVDMNENNTKDISNVTDENVVNFVE